MCSVKFAKSIKLYKGLLEIYCRFGHYFHSAALVAHKEMEGADSKCKNVLFTVMKGITMSADKKGIYVTVCVNTLIACQP